MRGTSKGQLHELVTAFSICKLRLSRHLSTNTSMPRLLKVAAAQVGAVHRSTPRAEVLERLIKLVREAAQQGVKLAVFREPPPKHSSDSETNAQPRLHSRPSSLGTTSPTKPSSHRTSSTQSP